MAIVAADCPDFETENPQYYSTALKMRIDSNLDDYTQRYMHDHSLGSVSLLFPLKSSSYNKTLI